LAYRAQTILTTITIPSNGWHVGDAAGLDALVRDYNPEATVHRIQGNQSWHFAERSQRMVDAVGAGPEQSVRMCCMLSLTNPALLDARPTNHLADMALALGELSPMPRKRG